MATRDVSKYAFFAVLVILAYFSFLVIKPIVSYLLFSVVLAMLFRPSYLWLVKKTGRPRLASTLLVIGLILLLVLPAIWIGITLIQQAPRAYEGLVTNINTTGIDSAVQDTLGVNVTVSEWARHSVASFREYVVRSAPEFLTSATQVVLGLFIMFFVMFFLFTQADYILKRVHEVTPLSKKHTNALLEHINQVVHGIMEGQVLTGLIQGGVGWIIFMILGIPNALFWGFVMAITAMIPFVGSAAVWMPAAAWLLFTGSIWRGVALFIIGGVVISQLDNVLRPYLVGRYAEVHPALVLVGVIGGLGAFGIIGFVVGPLVLALLITFLRFYSEEF